ncbi:phage capsid protein [Lactobacillus crispatus]
MIINDLQETIVRNINQQIKAGFKAGFFYNTQPVYIKFLDKYDELGFVPNPGSHVVEQDYSGVQLKQFNYAFTIRTTHRAEAKNRLFEISQYLQTLNETHDLTSENGTWRFDHLEVPSEPAEIQEDIQGTVTYSMDVAVFIYKQKGVF